MIKFIISHCLKTNAGKNRYIYLATSHSKESRLAVFFFLSFVVVTARWRQKNRKKTIEYECMHCTCTFWFCYSRQLADLYKKCSLIIDIRKRFMTDRYGQYWIVCTFFYLFSTEFVFRHQFRILFALPKYWSKYTHKHTHTHVPLNSEKSIYLRSFFSVFFVIMTYELRRKKNLSFN